MYKMLRLCVLLGLLAAAFPALPASATSAATSPMPARAAPLAKIQGPPCGSDLDTGARVLVYKYATAAFGRTLAPDGDRSYAGKLIADSQDYKLRSNDTWANAALSFASDFDSSMRFLAYNGFGSWDGCYGRNAASRIMTARVHYPEPGAWWQGDSSFGEAVFSDEYVSKASVVHEWTHAIVDRTTGMRADGGPRGETGALYESLADTFAVLATHRYDLRITSGTRRSLQNPTRYGQVDHISKFDEYGDNYSNAGVPSTAAYLLIAGGKHPQEVVEKNGVRYEAVDVPALGYEKVQRIYFHALNRKFLYHDDGHEQGDFSFAEFSRGVWLACRDLAAALDIQRTGLEKADCDAVQSAFEAVGMVPPKFQTARPVPSTPKPASVLFVGDDGVMTLLTADVPIKAAINAKVADFRLSPDGQRVAVGDEGQNWTVWSLPVDGAMRFGPVKAPRMTAPPVWSPSGARLYGVDPNSQTAFTWEIGQDSAQPLSFYPGTTPQWSPDEKYLAWQEGKALWVGALHGDAQQLVQAADPYFRWSPVEAKLAYASDNTAEPMSAEPDNRVASIYDAAMAKTTRLLAGGGIFDWFPDGKGLVLMHIDGVGASGFAFSLLAADAGGKGSLKIEQTHTDLPAAVISPDPNVWRIGAWEVDRDLANVQRRRATGTHSQTFANFSCTTARPAASGRC
jgi:hypothetical protein